MPYEWLKEPPKALEKSGAFCHSEGGQPMAHLLLWPHRSLTAPGLVWFIGLTSGMISLPLIGLLGSKALWGLLPFLMAAVVAIWWALDRNTRDGDLTEELTLWQDHVELIRQDPKRGHKDWSANPYWVKITLYKDGGPVENYLTLKGSDREVEIGAFLSPDERSALKHELQSALDCTR